MSGPALVYDEPTIVTVLTQSSFLLSLNVVSFILDQTVYCGLIGQMLVGLAWGTPGAKALPRNFEETVTQLGYLGLILVVFEGGLATSSEALGADLWLSVCVALTGIALPIALSFSLIGISTATTLQAFAAGASLCSTSLGTTFSLLKTTGLTNSRLGIILISAAMLDDVVGLVLVQIISNLAPKQESIQATTVIRPIFVSLAFALLLPLICVLFVKPVIPQCHRLLQTLDSKMISALGGYSLPLPFLLSSALLVGLVCAASYAGTSNLLAAYLAGAIVAWVEQSKLDQGHPGSEDWARSKIASTRSRECTKVVETDQAREQVVPIPESSHDVRDLGGTAEPQSLRTSHEIAPSSMQPPEANHSGLGPSRNEPGIDDRSREMYNCYYAPIVDQILRPFFFASIGFAIPISEMFRGPAIWRGIVYAVLMALGKLCCGLWLVRFLKTLPISIRGQQTSAIVKGDLLPRPDYLLPAAILGCAMVARGEIGFLISALAASKGIFGSGESSETGTRGSGLVSELYLVVTWAILLCTIVGPLSLGFLVKRVKQLQIDTGQHGGISPNQDPLGIWGIR
jgi:Kef-type K+ transport system membrane component KefB